MTDCSFSFAKLAHILYLYQVYSIGALSVRWFVLLESFKNIP